MLGTGDLLCPFFWAAALCSIISSSSLNEYVSDELPAAQSSCVQHQWFHSCLVDVARTCTLY